MAGNTDPQTTRRMIPVPDPRVDISVGVSQVLHEVGLNKEMIEKMRRAILLRESLAKIANRLKGDNIVKYYFGSQSEGTTTLGLRSDLDVLSCHLDYNVIQRSSEYEPEIPTLMMVRDKDVPPGYCLLQLLSDTVPSKYFVEDTHGRLVLKNTIVESYMVGGDERQGPSCASTGAAGDLDFVIAFHCKSWPEEATDWLKRKICGNWPSDDLKSRAAKSGCFVVPVGKKGSGNEELQWRISTSLAERHLTFSLNLSQIRCFVLMKMVLKRIIKPQCGASISSFMCKTVLFYCIERTHADMWEDCKLLHCFTMCLTALRDCVVTGDCPHYIIPGNNLMLGKMTSEIQHKLSELLDGVIQTNGMIFFGFEIDSLGTRLQQKFHLQDNLSSQPGTVDVCSKISSKALFGVATYVPLYHEDILEDFLTDTSSDNVSTFVSKSISVLEYIADEDGEIDKVSSKLLLPLFKTTLASLKAVDSIRNKVQITDETIQTFETGFDSDVASSRLKLASVLYCSGDLTQAAEALIETERGYDVLWVEPMCSCNEYKETEPRWLFQHYARASGEDIIKDTIAFCVRYMHCEKECIPKELQYEFHRSTTADMPFRGPFDEWMDCVVVDSLPFLYFLFYKVYGHLGRHNDQRIALSNLTIAINTEPNLGHRETALNILGQCLEQEGRLSEAFRVYLRSLMVRKSNNVAKVHICMLLARILGANNPSDHRITCSV